MKTDNNSVSSLMAAQQQFDILNEQVRYKLDILIRRDALTHDAKAALAGWEWHLTDYLPRRFKILEDFFNKETAKVRENHESRTVGRAKVDPQEKNVPGESTPNDSSPVDAIERLASILGRLNSEPDWMNIAIQTQTCATLAWKTNAVASNFCIPDYVVQGYGEDLQSFRGAFAEGVVSAIVKGDVDEWSSSAMITKEMAAGIIHGVFLIKKYGNKVVFVDGTDEQELNALSEFTSSIKSIKDI